MSMPSYTELKIAMECDFPDTPPQVLWRVVFVQKALGRDLRFTAWWDDEANANSHVERIVEKGGKILSFDKYSMKSEKARGE